jgi:two-component system response regulator AdeR
MENALILIVEDEPEISDILERYFEREGFRVLTASDGEIGLSHHQRLQPDLVVLDVKLPKLDGHAVLSTIRQRSNTPVIMVTALADDLDKLHGLRSGADDYVVKPFNPVEVVARARAVLRRTTGSAANKVLRVGRLAIDPIAHMAVVEDGESRMPLNLTRTECHHRQPQGWRYDRRVDHPALLIACRAANGLFRQAGAFSCAENPPQHLHQFGCASTDFAHIPFNVYSASIMSRIELDQ